MNGCLHRGTLIIYDDGRGMPVCQGCGQGLQDPARMLRAIQAMSDESLTQEARIRELEGRVSRLEAEKGGAHAEQRT